MFHSIDGLDVIEQQAANVRQFVGDGTPFLKVPGLKDQPTAVRLGQNILPMTITQEFPGEVPGRFETRITPLYIVQVRSDGMPILLRSQQSNDGVWQAGVPVYVQGEWEGDAQAGEGPDPAAAEAAKVEADAQAAAEAAANAKK